MLARFCLCVKKFELVLFVFSLLTDFCDEFVREDILLEVKNTTPPWSPSTRGIKYQSNYIVTAAERNLIALSVILNSIQDLPLSIHETPAYTGMTANKEIIGTNLKLYSVLFPLVEGVIGSHTHLSSSRRRGCSPLFEWLFFYETFHLVKCISLSRSRMLLQILPQFHSRIIAFPLVPRVWWLIVWRARQRRVMLLLRRPSHHGLIRTMYQKDVCRAHSIVVA